MKKLIQDLKKRREQYIVDLECMSCDIFAYSTSTESLKEEIYRITIVIDFLEEEMLNQKPIKNTMTDACNFLWSITANSEINEDEEGYLIMFDKDENWLFMQDEFFNITWVNHDLIWDKLSNDYGLSDCEIEELIIDFEPEITKKGEYKPRSNKKF